MSQWETRIHSQIRQAGRVSKIHTLTSGPSTCWSNRATLVMNCVTLKDFEWNFMRSRPFLCYTREGNKRLENFLSLQLFVSTETSIPTEYTRKHKGWCTRTSKVTNDDGDTDDTTLISDDIPNITAKIVISIFPSC